MAGLFDFLRKRKDSDQIAGRVVRHVTLVNPFHAVSVITPFDNPSCKAAKDCAGLRFLSAEAPALPMTGCDAAQCRCRYQHHDDRRAGPRRRTDVWAGGHSMWNGEEQRRSRGRRVTDL